MCHDLVLGGELPWVPGASTRSPAHGKGQEVKGSYRQGKSGLKGASLNFLKHLPPKSVCLPYRIMLSTYSSDITGGLTPTTFLWKKLT